MLRAKRRLSVYKTLVGPAKFGLIHATLVYGWHRDDQLKQGPAHEN